MEKFLQGIDELLVGIVTAIILSTVSTFVYLAIHGWRGIVNMIATWGISCFVGVLAHWGCLEWAVSGTLTAIIISLAALLSHTVLGVLFHPDLQAALLERLKREVRTRGGGAGKDGE